MSNSIDDSEKRRNAALFAALSQPAGEKSVALLLRSSAGSGVSVLDQSGVVAIWDEDAERISGYAADEMKGASISRLFTEADERAGRWEALLAEAKEKGYARSEGWRLRKDGTRFWAFERLDAIRDRNGGLLGFAHFIHGLHGNPADPAKADGTERQFQLLVESVTDYALFMLDRNGVVSSWNTGADRIKGYAAREIIGRHFSLFYTDRDRLAGLPQRALQIAEAVGRYEAEGWRVRKNGKLFWANVIIDAIKDGDANVVGFVKITQDITEKRESRLALEKAEEQSGRARRMEALGHLTGGVAHDFNNLLMIIGGFTHTLKKAVGQDPKGARAIEAIGMAVERGQTLTRQLLTFSRRQTLNPTVTSVGERIEAFSKMLGSSNANPVKLVACIPPGVWSVEADIGELELALLNITINARDAMPDGGLITVAAENVHLRRDDTPSQIEGDFVAVTISDEGTGIAQDVLPKVFDPFFTTKEQSKGSGLGLSQVYGFAHQSGGTVTIASKAGEGTKVTLYFPKANSAAKGPAEEPAAFQQSHRGTALLVDDNRDVLELSALYLEELGYQVEAFDNAQPALKAVERQKFELVVSDIVMAGMDGIDLAHAIRRRQPDMPIVLVTGYSRVPASVGEEFVLVRKPYQLEDLSRAVSTAIAASSRPQQGSIPH